MPLHAAARRAGLALAIVVGLTYLLTAAGHLQTMDVGSELAVAQALVTHHSIVITGQEGSVPGLGGRGYGKHAIGESLLLLPAAFIGAHSGASHAHTITVALASFVNPVAAAAATIVFYAFLLELGVAIGPAVALSLLLAFATIQWPYAHDPFDVTPTECLLLLAIYAAYHSARSARPVPWSILSGAALGGAVLVREASLICIPFVLALLADASERTWPARLRSALAWCVSLAVAGGVTAWYAWARFGSLLGTGYGHEGFTTPLLDGLAGLLLSPGKSLFLFSPVLLLGLVGFPRFLQERTVLALAIAGLVVVNIVFYARWDDWSGDWAWGPRFMVPLTPLLLLPASAIVPGWARRSVVVRGAVLALVAASLSIQVSGVVVDYQLQMELMQNAGTLRYEHWSPQYSQVVTQPQAMWQVARGTATFPATRRNPALSRPPVNTWDLWWVYAWITGAISHRIILTGVAGAGLAIAGGGAWLWRVLQTAGRGRTGSSARQEVPVSTLAHHEHIAGSGG
jgi:hypothetical protein